MKIEDIGLDSLKGISKVEIDGISESFYLVGLNTIRVKYKSDSREIVSLEANGVNLPLDNPEVVEQFKSALSQAKGILKVERKEARKVRKSELGLNAFTGVSHVLGRGMLETFYLIGVNNAVSVKYDSNTDEVLAVVVNGSKLPLDDEEAVNKFIESVKKAAEEKTPVILDKPKEKQTVLVKELGLNGLNGKSHLCGNNIQETFYLVGINNAVKVKYNVETDEVLEIVVNGTPVQLENEQEVEEFRNAVKETVENHSSNITKSPNASKPKVKLGDLGLGQLDGLSKVDKDGIVETFYLIGVHNVRVKYDEFTREVVSLSVDGRITDIKDQESVNGAIDSINAILQMTGNHK